MPLIPGNITDLKENFVDLELSIYLEEDRRLFEMLIQSQMDTAMQAIAVALTGADAGSLLDPVVY